MAFTGEKPQTKANMQKILKMIQQHPMSPHMVADAMGFSTVAGANYLKMLHTSNLIHIKSWIQTNNGSPLPMYAVGHLPDAPRKVTAKPVRAKRPESYAKPATTPARPCDPLVAAFFYGVFA